MIYLLETFTGILGDVPEKSVPIHAMKIGYTNDNRGEGRFKDYTNAGFVIRILKTIPGGSLALGHLVQEKFLDYLAPIERKSIEWFYFRPEILDFFNSCETEDDILRSLGITKGDLFVDVRKPVTGFVEFFNKFGEVSEEDREIFLPILEKLDEISMFDRKLRYICEEVIVNMDNEFANKFINVLPIIYRTLLVNLSPEILYAKAYRKGPLVEHFEESIYFSGADVREKIISAFPIGTRVSSKDAKEKLREIYNSLDFKKSPKATDLLDYFNCSVCGVLRNDNSKKRDKGYRILSIKQ